MDLNVSRDLTALPFTGRQLVRDYLTTKMKASESLKLQNVLPDDTASHPIGLESYTSLIAIFPPPDCFSKFV
jgi:hypothetical protein